MANYASELLKVAQSQVGYLEKETNKNLDSKTANAGDENYTKYARDFDTKYKTFYNGKKQGAAWCDIFVDWCFVTAFGEDEAQKLLGQPDKSCGAGCGWSANYFKKIGRFTKKPIVGAQIFFTDSKGEVCHTGIVKKIGTKYIYTIEGNTSSASGVVANGGAVAEKKYELTYSRIYGYGIPKFELETEEIKNDKATTQSSSVAKKKSNAEIAKEVLAGKWGNGEDRKKKLKAAGYDYNAIQAIVNKSCAPKKKSNVEIAREVMAGKWGNGLVRKRKLKAAGYDYNEIQKIVNRMK